MSEECKPPFRLTQAKVLPTLRPLFALVLLLGGRDTAGAQSCELLVAALAGVAADSGNTVLLDRTVMGVPTFAFNAYSGSRRGDTALAQTMEPPLRTLNATRLPIPPCMAKERSWATVSDSALFAIFAPNGKRWDGFHELFPQATQFALVSQPIIVGDTATIYVATAGGALTGRGVILRLVRGADGRWVKDSEVQLWVS